MSFHKSIQFLFAFLFLTFNSIVHAQYIISIELSDSLHAVLQKEVDNGADIPITRGPDFPGYDAGLDKYFKNNLSASCMDSCNGYRIAVDFVIDTLGNVVEAKIEKPYKKICDDEAIRVMLASPKWKPCTHGNRKIRVHMRYYVRFEKD